MGGTGVAPAPAAVRIRKSASKVSAAEWNAFINAINAMHGMGIPAPDTASSFWCTFKQ